MIIELIDKYLDGLNEKNSTSTNGNVNISSNAKRIADYGLKILVPVKVVGCYDYQEEH